jgi:hypothetical protein
MTSVVGTVIAVRNSLDTGHWLGLIVDQKAGKAWADADPCMEHQLDAKWGPLLVRVLGRKVNETPAMGRSTVPEREPSRDETVRWVYVQTLPHPLFYAVAGPGGLGVEAFLDTCRTCDSLGMKGATFLHELQLLADHLKGIEKPKREMSYFERQYRAMLAEVLPLSSLHHRETAR